MDIIKNILLGLYFINALLLIGLMAAQTTKNEGLSGFIGGGNIESPFKGKKTVEDRIVQLTTISAITFLILSILFTIGKFS